MSDTTDVQTLKAQNDVLSQDIRLQIQAKNLLQEENARLKAQLAEYKELLRECQPYIKQEKEDWIQQGYWDAGKQILKISNLLTKINEVLR